MSHTSISTEPADKVLDLLCSFPGVWMSLDQICQTIQIDSDALAPCIAELLLSNQIEMAVTPDGFGVYYYPMATAGSPPPAPRLASSCS